FALVPAFAVVEPWVDVFAAHDDDGVDVAGGLQQAVDADVRCGDLVDIPARVARLGSGPIDHRADVSVVGGRVLALLGHLDHDEPAPGAVLDHPGSSPLSWQPLHSA